MNHPVFQNQNDKVYFRDVKAIQNLKNTLENYKLKCAK